MRLFSACSRAHTHHWLGWCGQGPLDGAVVGLPSLPNLQCHQEGKVHGSCCPDSNRVSSMWCLSSSLRPCCSSSSNTSFLATQFPPQNYGIAKDLSQGMAGDGALPRAEQGGCCVRVRLRGWYPFLGTARPAPGLGSAGLARSSLRSLELKPVYHHRQTLSPLAAGCLARSSLLDRSHPRVPVGQMALKTRGLAACAWGGWKAPVSRLVWQKVHAQFIVIIQLGPISFTG